VVVLGASLLWDFHFGSRDKRATHLKIWRLVLIFLSSSLHERSGGGSQLKETPYFVVEDL